MSDLEELEKQVSGLINIVVNLQNQILKVKQGMLAKQTQARKNNVVPLNAAQHRFF